MLSVVVVTYRSRNQIGACLRTVWADAESSGLRVEVIVVDNASPDDTVRVVRAVEPAVRVVEQDDNVGFGRACNTGAAATRAPLLLFLNPDTEVCPGTLAALLDAERREPGAGCYGGRTVRPDGVLDPASCWAAPTLWSTWCFGLGLSTAFRSSPRFNPEAMPGWQRDVERPVGVVTGCLLLVQRPLFERLGGFDPAYFMYGEDVDLCLRAAEAGHQPMITPLATVVHASGASSSSAGKNVLLLTGKATLIRRRWPPWRARAGLAGLWVGVGLRAAAATVGSGADSRTAPRDHRRIPSSAWAVTWQQRSTWLAGWPDRSA